MQYCITSLTRKQSEIADLRQRHVVRQVAAPYSVWQRFPLCPIVSNVNKNFKVIQNPGFLPDHPQNWITGSFCHTRHSQKISQRSIHNFLSYLANTQTNKLWQKHNLLGGGNNGLCHWWKTRHSVVQYSFAMQCQSVLFLHSNSILVHTVSVAITQNSSVKGATTRSPAVARIANHTGCQWPSRSSTVDLFMPLPISD